MKEFHWLILQHLSEGQGPVGPLSRDRGTGRDFMVLSLCLESTNRVTHPFAPPCPCESCACTSHVLPYGPAKAGRHMLSTQGTLITCSGGQGTCVPGSKRAVTIRETIHYRDSTLKNIPSLSVKQAYLLAQSFSLSTTLHISYISGGCGGAFRKREPGDTIFTLSLSLATFRQNLQKGAYILI